VLLGAVGGPKWEGLDYSIRPERRAAGASGSSLGFGMRIFGRANYMPR